MAEFDTDALVARIIQDAKIPRGSQYRDAGVLLRMSDDAMRTVIMPELLRVGEGHLAAVKSVPLVAGQSRVRMPSRAVRLLDVSLLNAEGVPLYGFARATVEQERELRSLGYLRKPGAPRLWMLEGSTIVLAPAVEASGAYTLVLRYARRPSRLSLAASCGTVTGTDTVGSVTTLTFAPSGALGTPSVLDVVKGTPDFESLADDTACTSTSATTVTVPSSLGAMVEVGDYLCPPGTSPVPQIPLDYHPVLAQAVVVHVLKEQRDVEGMTVAQGTLAALLASAQPTIDARSEEPEVCVVHNWL